MACNYLSLPEIPVSGAKFLNSYLYRIIYWVQETSDVKSSCYINQWKDPYFVWAQSKLFRKQLFLNCWKIISFCKCKDVVCIHGSTQNLKCQGALDTSTDMKWVYLFDNIMTSSNGNIFRVTGHLCGEFTGPRWIPAQRPVTRSFNVFFDLRLNKRLSKQWWGWWFETLLHPLWRHRYE